MKNHLFFGLNDDNIEKLKEGKPIRFNLKEMEMDDINIYIFHGKNEETMQEMFQDLIHPDVTKSVDKRPKEGHWIDKDILYKRPNKWGLWQNASQWAISAPKAGVHE